jgi:hypothetical protein
VDLTIVELLVANGIPATDIGIVTPYNAQKQLLLYALAKLHEEYPDSNFDKVLVDSVDKFQGSDKAIVIFDSVVTHNMGFADNHCRLLVATTRARDGFVFIGRTASLVTQHGVSEIQKLYNMAIKRDIAYTLDRGHDAMKHRHIQPRVRLTSGNVEELHNAPREDGATYEDATDSVMSDDAGPDTAMSTVVDKTSACGISTTAADENTGTSAWGAGTTAANENTGSSAWGASTTAADEEALLSKRVKYTKW